MHQLESLGWDTIDQGQEIPSDPSRSLRHNFRQWILPEVFDESVATLNTTADGQLWLTDKQLHDLQDQILRQPHRTLLEANEAIQKLLFKAQVDVNEITGEQDPVVKLIDFSHPENNHFLNWRQCVIRRLFSGRWPIPLLNWKQKQRWTSNRSDA